MIYVLTSATSEQLEEFKGYGGFNDAPPNFKEITAKEFAESGFFTWCKVATEHRQIIPDRISRKALRKPIKFQLSYTLFYMNHGSHFAMTVDNKKVRYFTFAKCHHGSSVELSMAEANAIGHRHFGNCYHVHKCNLCGHVWAYDSSG